MLKVWFSGGLCSVRSTAALNDHKGPFQLEQFYVSSQSLQEQQMCLKCNTMNFHLNIRKKPFHGESGQPPQ